MYYVKKPIPIRAFDFSKTKVDHEGINLFDGIDKQGKYYIHTSRDRNTIIRHTLLEDDFVIIGIKGERYPCKRDIFLESYESSDSELSTTFLINKMNELIEQLAQRKDLDYEKWLELVNKLENIK